MKVIIIVTQRRRFRGKLILIVNCDTCLVEDESIRMGGENSIPLEIISHDLTCQPLGLEGEFCDRCSLGLFT